MGDLKTLIRLHRWRLDEKRRALADLHALVECLREQAMVLEEDIKAEQETVRSAPEIAFSYANFAVAALNRRRTLAASIAQVEQQIVTATDEMHAVFQEVKRYELAQEERDRRTAERQRRRDTAMLDEVAATGFERRQREAKASS